MRMAVQTYLAEGRRLTAGRGTDSRLASRLPLVNAGQIRSPTSDCLQQAEWSDLQVTTGTGQYRVGRLLSPEAFDTPTCSVALSLQAEAQHFLTQLVALRASTVHSVRVTFRLPECRLDF